MIKTEENKEKKGLTAWLEGKSTARLSGKYANSASLDIDEIVMAVAVEDYYRSTGREKEYFEKIKKKP